jgi:hypothetical protein
MLRSLIYFRRMGSKSLYSKYGRSKTLGLVLGEGLSVCKHFVDLKGERCGMFCNQCIELLLRLNTSSIRALVFNYIHMVSCSDQSCSVVLIALITLIH